MKRLKALPRRADETWQGGLVRMPFSITGADGESCQPWLPLWIATQSEKVHSGEPLMPHERNLAAALEALLEFACESESGGYRPGRIEVADAALAERLGHALAGTEIEIRLVERMEAVEEFLDAMLDVHEGGEGGGVVVPSPLEGTGVTVDDLRRFAEAAAAFYRAAPWQFLTDVDLIHVERPTPPQGMEYAVVLGRAGAVYGLGFYRSRTQDTEFRRAVAQGRRPELGSAGLWQVVFEPITTIPPKDADLWEEHDLPVASPEAYPFALHREASGKITRPGTSDLAFLVALLKAFSETSEAEIDTGRWNKVVPTGKGAVEVTLAIPDLIEPPSFQEWMKRGFSPDRRANERMFADMNRYFAEHPAASIDAMNEATSRLFVGKKIDELVTQPDTPLERAQELCFHAFETQGRRRVQLARQAIQVCSDCADAYVILAEHAASPAAERDFYAQGVAAGERALGPEVFEKEAGHFWGIQSTRPYMRARFGLAQTIEQEGRVEEALGHYQDLLRLNPNDNQGVRYSLMPCLLRSGRDAEAARLLKGSAEESSLWALARALLAFRLSGNSMAANRELHAAFRANPCLPEYLLADEPLPILDAYSPGSPEEAVFCVGTLRPAFAATAGALDWVAAHQRQREKELDARRKEQRRKERQKDKKKKKRR
ncbi:MAG: DUF6930 domain-containing protein [Pirellulales bacterium]